MDFNKYIADNRAFTTFELLRAFNHSPSIPVALSRAVKAGKVTRVRQGLYVSQYGKFLGAKIDPYYLAQAFSPDAVFIYHSALKLHGIAHSIFNRVQFMTSEPGPLFFYEGLSYESFAFRDNAQRQAISGRSYASVVTTDREQTLVDCMANLKASGGAEEVIRSFAGLPYVDVDAILYCLTHYPAAVAARVGWYLELNQERWSVENRSLDTIEGWISKQASYKLDPAHSKFEAYNSRWRLNLPAPEETIRMWT